MDNLSLAYYTVHSPKLKSKILTVWIVVVQCHNWYPKKNFVGKEGTGCFEKGFHCPLIEKDERNSTSNINYLGSKG